MAYRPRRHKGRARDQKRQRPAWAPTATDREMPPAQRARTTKDEGGRTPRVAFRNHETQGRPDPESDTRPALRLAVSRLSRLIALPRPPPPWPAATSAPGLWSTKAAPTISRPVWRRSGSGRNPSGKCTPLLNPIGTRRGHTDHESSADELLRCPTALWLAVGAVAFGDLWLAAISIRRQVVLGGVTATAGFALLASVGSRGVNGEAARAALGFALVFLILGIALVGLGGFLQHLLDDPPGSQDQ